MIYNPNDGAKFLQKLLLTNTQVSNLCIAFARKPSTYIKRSKTQFSEMIQSRLLVPLIKTGLPLTKYVIKPLAKFSLIPLGINCNSISTRCRNT